MSFYELLSIVTVIIATLGVAIWLRARSVALPIGIGLIYYWSLYGAWSIVTDRLGGNSGKHYQYLFEKLFPIDLDHEYWATLVLYSAFIVIVEITLLILVRPPRIRGMGAAILRVSHVRLFSIAAVAGLGSFAIVRSSILLAAALGESGYAVTRAGTVGTLFTLHQILNRVALDGLIMGAVVLVSTRPRYLTAERSRAWLFVYVAALGSMLAFCIVLGNKNELFFAFLFGMLLYLANEKRPRTVLLAGLTIVGVGAVMFVDIVRGMPVREMAQNLRWDYFMQGFRGVGSSNEAFGAHFSMYGALRFHVPLTHGSSLISLAASAIPRAIWPNRPADIYGWYADHVSATPGQGYSIHHATGWYLNFGVPGVVLGAIVLGAVWAMLLNGHNRLYRVYGVVATVFFVIAPWSFTANIPNLMRAGIEAYKAVAVDAFLTPALILYLALYPKPKTVPRRLYRLVRRRKVVRSPSSGDEVQFHDPGFSGST